MSDDDLEEQVVTARRQPQDSPYDLYSIAAALAAYNPGGGSGESYSFYSPSGSGGGVEPTAAPPLPVITVTAPRPTPAPTPTPPPPRRVYLPPAAPPAPQEGFVAPPPIVPEVKVTAPRVRPAKPVTRVGRGFGLLALVPLWMAAMGKLDALSTASWQRRLNPPTKPPRGIARPELPPDPFRYGRPRPWGISGPPLPARQPRVGGDQGRPFAVPGDDLTVITVTAPKGKPAPIGDPHLVPVGMPFPTLFPVRGNPAPALAPDPSTLPVPEPRAQPRPGVGPAPSLAPFPEPVPTPGTRPQPRPGVRAPTIPSPLPFTPAPTLAARPLAPPIVPPTKTDTCSCAPKKPQKKNRKPRTECWLGTYIEKQTGLSKRRRERVDCRTGKPIAQ